MLEESETFLSLKLKYSNLNNDFTSFSLINN